MSESFIDVGGTTLRVRIDGPAGAPPLLLINSLSTTLEMWDSQIPALSGHFRTIRYDQRGHGKSSSPAGPYSINDLGGEAIRLLDVLNVDRTSVAGVSLGGMIAMWMAINASERVTKIVAACTSANFSPPEFWEQRAELVRSRGMSVLFEPLLERWFTPRIDERNPEAKPLLKQMIDSCDAEGYASVCEALGAADLRDQLAVIASPTLIVAGAYDPAAPPAVAISLFEAIPDASLVVIPDSSHLANLEQPDLFVDAMLEHFVGSARSRGMKVRTEVLGEQHVTKATRNANEFTEGFQDFISRYAWGEIWNRPGLDRRSRSIVTLTTLVALGHLNELSFHIPAALRNGLTKSEIAEILIQCGIYAGVPAANSAFAKADEIFNLID